MEIFHLLTMLGHKHKTKKSGGKMKRILIYHILLLLLVLSSPANALELKRGDLFHITGCENGELALPVVRMWSKPGGIVVGAKVVGKLSGDGRADQGLKCQGAVVKLLEIKKISGRTFLKIKSVVNSKIGWLTDSFVGKKFNKTKCKTFFSNPQHIKNCLGK